MNFIVELILLVIKFSTIISASSNNENIEEERIVGGQESKPHSHPYVVSLQTRLLWFRWHVCGGSILNERWILTAAHCTTESWLTRWLPLDVVAGDHNVHSIGPNAQIRTVNERIEHSLYKGGISSHDIAVLRLDTPWTFNDDVQPISLPYNSKMSNDPLVLAGWGVLKTTFFIPDLPNGLQEVKVNYIPYNECRKAIDDVKDSNEDNPLDKDAHICTGPISGGVAACSGDSGGPLIQFVPKNKLDHRAEDSQDVYDEVILEDNKIEETNPVEIANEDDVKIPVVRGIVSWGITPCGNKGAPTVYTKISQYMDFINAHVKL